MRPLYTIPRRSQRPRYLDGQSHPGLWMQKLCPLWEEDASSSHRPTLRQPLGWCETFTQQPIGEADALAEHAARRARLIEARGGLALDARAMSSLIVAMRPGPSGGLLMDPTLGVPTLPAASLKGVARDWAEQWIDADAGHIQEIFGAPGGAPGAVAWLEGLPLAPVHLQVDLVATHYAEYYDLRESLAEASGPSDWLEPDVEHFLVVPEGTTFQLGLLPSRPDLDPETLQRAAWWLGEAMTMIGVGARTSAGYGRLAASPPDHLTVILPLFREPGEG